MTLLTYESLVWTARVESDNTCMYMLALLGPLEMGRASMGSLGEHEGVRRNVTEWGMHFTDACIPIATSLRTET